MRKQVDEGNHWVSRRPILTFVVSRCEPPARVTCTRRIKAFAVPRFSRCAGRMRTSDLVQAMSSVAFFSQDPGGRCAIDRVES